MDRFHLQTTCYFMAFCTPEDCYSNMIRFTDNLLQELGRVIAFLNGIFAFITIQCILPYTDN